MGESSPLPCRPTRARYRRRDVLGLVLTPLAVTPLTGTAQAEDAATAPPQPGDHLVFLTGPGKGQPIHAGDIALGGPQVQAYPAAPDGTVRNGSRLNLVILARFDPASLSEATRTRAADGVVAYTGVCTHQGCPVNQWSKERDAFVCSCHGSVFDPRNDAEVLNGPAPRPLPALGLKIADGVVTVATGFTARVGGMQS